MSGEYDIVIAGGGLAGISLACALAPGGARMAVIEATPPKSDRPPSFDDRAIALAHGSRRIFEAIGLTPAEVLRRASYDMAVYLNQDEDLGSIEKGKYADFFLVPGDPTQDLNQLRQIRMVVSDGVVYYPTEIYPWFGIRPFSELPAVTVMEQAPSD